MANEKEAVKKEKKTLKKGTKVLLGIVLVLAMIGLCIGLGALYMKRQGVQKTFEMPEAPARETVVELPIDAFWLRTTQKLQGVLSQDSSYDEKEADALLAFALDLYAAQTTADDVEGGWSTSVSLAGELTTPFAPADNAIAGMIRDNAAGQITPLYPSVAGVLWSEMKDVPVLPLKKETMLSGKCSLEGDNYILQFDVDPAVVNVAQMEQSDVFAGIKDLFASAATVESIGIQPQSVGVRFSVDRTNGHLNTVAITRSFRVATKVALTEAYRALTADGAAEISLPYETTQTISFNHYGASFAERQIVMRYNDEEYMPLNLNLPADVTDDEFTVHTTCSDPDALEVQDDGLMIAKHATQEPVTVTVVLEYKGHTYTDTLIVHLTEMELEANTNV